MINPTQSIYYQNEKYWKFLEEWGKRPNVVRLSMLVSTFADLDRALGFSHASSAWVRKNQMPSMKAERAAEAFFSQNEDSILPNDDAGSYTVIIPADKAETILSVLGLLGCLYEKNDMQINKEKSECESVTSLLI